MRVIAGALGGRRLVAPRGAATRPTSDRVREALFSILGDLAGARVLDLYAGTGALGIEALSRGAELAVFVESARPALDALRANLASLDLGARARVMATPVDRALAALAAERGTSITGATKPCFDLVFLDPPYAETSDALALAASHLAPGPETRIVVEHATRSPPTVPANLERSALRRYGDTSLSFFLGKGVPAPTPPVSL